MSILGGIFEEGFFPIKGESLRNWLRTDASQLFSAFETGAEALDYLRGQGAAIRTQDFYAIRREVLSIGKYQAQLETLSFESLIPIGWTVDNHGLDLSADFLYRFNLTHTDPETGEVTTEVRSLLSDNQMTLGDALEEMDAVMSEYLPGQAIEFETISLREALMRPGAA